MFPETELPLVSDGVRSVWQQGWQWCQLLPEAGTTLPCAGDEPEGLGPVSLVEEVRRATERFSSQKKAGHWSSERQGMMGSG